jgi:hypothetical protein
MTVTRRLAANLATGVTGCNAPLKQGKLTPAARPLLALG